ncbi:MAG: chromophore lyase CpcT/CpeT [Phycisphaerales bacterium JB052]
MKHIISIGVLFVLMLGGCANTQSTRGDAVPSVKQLKRHLTGSFSSKAQATQDPEYYEIVLHMIPIWEDRWDGPWLYVEQAVASTADRPYRQRVYHLAQTGENEFVSTVYSFEDPMSYAGAYQDEFPLSDLNPDDLTIREGCAITVSWDASQSAFIGATNGNDCVSNLRGSTYATSEVFLHMDRLITWDRGFDDNDEQVWGAVKGGYIFDRVQ